MKVAKNRKEANMKNKIGVSVKESLVIQNIGPLKNVVIPEIKPITVLIGESASGKSCLLKITALFRYLFKVATVRAWLKSAGIKKSPFKIHAATYWKKCGLADMISKESYIQFSVEINGNKYTLEYKNGVMYLPVKMDVATLEYFKVAYISEYRNVISTWTENSLKQSTDKLGFYFSETLSDFIDGTIHEKEIYIPYFDVYLIVTKGRFGEIKYRIRNKLNTYNIKFQDSASGIQSSAPIIAILDYLGKKFDFKEAFNRSIFSYITKEGNLMEFKPITDINNVLKWVHYHIEEPELGLFPKSQYMLLQHVIASIFAPNLEVSQTLMFTTHSPYIITYLNCIIQQSITQKPDDNTPLIPRKSIAAFVVENGTARDLIDVETGLIDAVAIDDASVEVNDIFDRLLRKDANS